MQLLMWWVIPTTSLMPEGAPWPLKTSWLSSQGWVPSFVGKEESVATMAAAMSSRWRRQEWAVDNSKRVGGGRRRRRMQGQDGGNIYARRAGSRRHDKRGGAEGAGQGNQEADYMMRGGWGWTMRDKRAADDTTRGWLSRRQKMVEPACVGVRQCQCRRASVAVAPGEGAAGTHHHWSRGAINDDNEDATSKNDGNHNIVFFAMVAVGASDVACGNDGGGDSGSSTWLQFVVSWGVPEEEDQMMAWQAEPATGQGGACRTSRGGERRAYCDWNY
jgi:hypothetical protein